MGGVGVISMLNCMAAIKPTQAIEIDAVLVLALEGETHKGIAVRPADGLYGTSNEKFSGMC